MTVDRLGDEGDSHPAAADTPVVREADVADRRESPADQADSAVRTARTADYRATIDATCRAHAIEQGCTRVKEIEETIVTPGMRRIESEDPTRHVTGQVFCSFRVFDVRHDFLGMRRMLHAVTDSVQPLPMC